ncbi:MAG: hypothetical protein JWQ40_1249 [Segetibacter sp.]|nr:hypothetical protein [Segetibacter sp.]
MANSIGFSWTQCYWCNLLNENVINGQGNPARPIALAAMLVLCITLAHLWFIFPQQVGLQKTMAPLRQAQDKLPPIKSGL